MLRVFQLSVVVLLMVELLSLPRVEGHGYIYDPPQRSSLWRFNYGTPANYNDNELYCGGFSRQWDQNGGKCGICGDPYDQPQPRSNEAGGTYAKGIIAKTYTQGSVIEVAVKLTANHNGYFTFKLCPNNNVNKEATQECLDRNILKVVGSNNQVVGDKYKVNPGSDYKVRLLLPSGLTCTQCVLQWTYRAGNNWGCDNGDKGCCVGCGRQETFVNCADVAITGSSNVQKPQVQTTRPTASPRQVATRKLTATTSAPKIVNARGCRGVGAYAGNEQMNIWCDNNCNMGYCPSSHCKCS